MAAPDKIYLERILCSNEVYDTWKSQKTISDDIEYVRKNAFIEKAYNWLKNYAFVDDNKNVNLPTLLHDFLKDSRNF